MYRCNFHTNGSKSHPIESETATSLGLSSRSSYHGLMTDLHDRIERKKKDMENARLGMAQGIKYSSRSLGGHTTQYRRLCRLAGIKIDLPKPTVKIEAIKPIGKPCRYKACKGRNHALHGEKCPVASARGKTGGKSGEGDSKRRVGEANGRYIDGRKNAVKRQLISQVVVGQKIGKTAREILNINPITWLDSAITTAAVAGMLGGVRGVCSGCSQSIPAIQARKIHRADITQNPARVICDACEG